MILIDIDVKVERINVSSSGQSAIFEFRDTNNIETTLLLQLYKKQIDYIMKKFYEVDRKKLEAELRVEFLRREEIAIKGLREELDELRLEYSILADQLKTERGEEDAKAID